MMDVGAILIGLSVFVLALTFVISPFGHQNKKKIVQEHATGKPLIGNLKAQEEAALKKLRDLDFDYQTGKVSEEDYRPLRNQFVAEAAQIMEIEKQEDEQLEGQLKAHRQEKGQITKCFHCGRAMKPEDQFCPSCGQPVGIACQNCGKAVQPGDLYCTGCGTPVRKPVEAM